jgi:hypothetical protein
VKVWKPNPELMKQYWQAIVDEAQDELNDWELQFVSDLEARVRNGWPLTEAQEKKLEQIYADKTK